MEFVRRASGRPYTLAVFPGSFHPPTVAHLALAQAALCSVDEVLWVLPRQFPHKEYAGVTLEQRAELVAAVAACDPRFSAGITDGGLFIEMARECRQAYGGGLDIWLLCGRDAAERIAGWEYGSQGDFADQLREFGLLVAARGGDYSPPAALTHRIRPLPVEQDYSSVSATEVRRRIASGQPWDSLVPGAIVQLVNRLYTKSGRLQ